MVNLNAPVGHSGNPLIETSHLGNSSCLAFPNGNPSKNNVSFLSSIESGSRNCSTNVASRSARWPAKNARTCGSAQHKFALLQLPCEILEQIVQELDQNDCLSLLKTCSFLYNVVKPRLWNLVVVDADYTEFNPELVNFYRVFNPGFSPTFIKTSFRIRSFMSAMRRNACCSKVSQVLNSYFVRKLYFANIPPDFLDYELRGLMTGKSLLELPNLGGFLVNLKLIYCSFKSLVSSMPIDSVTCLSLSMELARPDLEKYTRGDLSPDAYRDLFPFRNLQRLSLSLDFDNHHPNSLILYYIVHSLILSGNDLSKTLRSLEISNNSTLISPDPVLSTSLVNMEPLQDTHGLIDVHIITNLFKPLFERHIRLEKLVKLAFSGFSLLPLQAHLLLTCVNLTSLEIFKLDRISEFQPFHTSIQSPSEYFTNNREALVSQLGPGFLTLLGNPTKCPQNILCNLHTLVLDYKECLKDSVIAFVHNLVGHNRLSRLHLTIRWNVSIARISPDPKTYCSTLIQKLAQSRVRRFSLDFKSEAPLHLNTVHDDSHELINKDMFLQNLSFFRKLHSLRIFCHSLDNSFLNLLINSPHLQLKALLFVDIFGPGAGGRPNMALHVPHESIFNNWYRVQHIAILLAKNNPSLAFIRINSCVFQVVRHSSLNLPNNEEMTEPSEDLSKKEGLKEDLANSIEVVPREGLNSWFDSLMKNPYRFFNL